MQSMKIKLYREPKRSEIQIMDGLVTIALKESSLSRPRTSEIRWGAIGAVDASKAREVSEMLMMASIIAARFDAGATTDEALTGFTVVDVYAEEEK